MSEDPIVHHTGSDVRDPILLETEVFHPPSMKGRKVFVQIDQEMITKLLLTFKEEARRVRQ